MYAYCEIVLECVGFSVAQIVSRFMCRFDSLHALRGYQIAKNHPMEDCCWSVELGTPLMNCGVLLSLQVFSHLQLDA